MFIETEKGQYINTDYNELEKYKMNRARALRERELENRVSKLENEIHNLKSALTKIYNKVS